MATVTEAQESSGFLQRFVTTIGRILVSLFVPVVTFVVLWQGAIFLRDTDAPQWVAAVIAVVWGVGGVVALFFVASFVIDKFPDAWRRRLTPFVFVGPALAILAWYLLLPTVRTFYISLRNANSTEFVGLDNYIFAFTSPAMLESFRNNLIWLFVGTGLSVGIGLLIAVLADRTGSKFESGMKAFIFLPMAISMVGASVIWRFVYEFRPAGFPQIGILNQIVVWFGGEPQAWLLKQPWNTLFLIIILVWLQTGFAMVIISAAIKGIPEELLEAARLDGANERQVFTKVMIPSIRGTLVTVSTTIVIFTLKIFDIVQAMTGGNFGTQVIANEQFTQMFRAFNFGRGAAIAIVLLLLVTPVMYYNLRQFGEQTEAF